MFPFSFTAARSVWYLHMERSSDRSGGKAKTGMQLLATCPSLVRPGMSESLTQT